jgi:hypothetical protein
MFITGGYKIPASFGKVATLIEVFCDLLGQENTGT